MSSAEKVVVGWREWLAVPSFGVERIKAKIDTGARTTALHAFDMEPFHRDGVEWIAFAIHPLQRDDSFVLQCEAPLVERRWVVDSGGHRQFRPIVEATIAIAGESWPIEISLTSRDEMGFRMLLGRTAMSGRLVVDPEQSYATGRPKRKRKKKKARTAPAIDERREEITP